MSKKIFSLWDYDHSQQAMEVPKGRSETIPNEALSLKELVRRSIIKQTLPDLANGLEYGDDEVYDDAFELGQDLSDYIDNRTFIERYRDRLAELKESATKPPREERPPVNPPEDGEIDKGDLTDKV